MFWIELKQAVENIIIYYLIGTKYSDNNNVKFKTKVGKEPDTTTRDDINRLQPPVLLPHVRSFPFFFLPHTLYLFIHVIA